MPNNEALYKEALKKGIRANLAEEWDEAIAAYRAALTEFSHSPMALAGLGEACFGKKEYAKALDCYKLAARHSQGEINYLKRVADLQERLGQLTEAGRTYMAIGEVLLRQRKLDEAIGNWQRAVRLESNLLGAHQRLAMVFQRQGNVKEAVREYLAIARILQMQGEKTKALQMCRAALRLDPGNSDVLTAVDLIQQGAAAFQDDEPELEPAPAEQPAAASITDTVRQMATVLEAEKQGWQSAKAPPVSDDPVSQAHKLAQEQLAEEIFREEEDENLLYGEDASALSKLERDALIGQAMDYLHRGMKNEAISCYEKVLKGGLRLPALFFTLGLLYKEQQRVKEARRILSMAGRDTAYKPAVEMILQTL